MKKILNKKYLIIGSGISGLSFAQGLNSSEYIIFEKEERVGGYCKTFKVEDYIWDYAGHFFHFNNPKIKNRFKNLLTDANTVFNKKNTKVYYKGQYVDAPFQFNIHQLEKLEFIDCLCDLVEAQKSAIDNSSFKEMLYGKFGKSISEKFLIPYNEKLYSCDLNKLEVNAMGRFFPSTDAEQIIKNFRKSNLKTYNHEFFYSKKGAEEFINALLEGVCRENIYCNEKITEIDYQHKIAQSKNYIIQYEYLINSMPFNELLDCCQMKYPPCFSSNQVLVFNMGFDLPSIDKEVHWIYYPEKEYCFYRVGFYNNILHQKKLSIYVEIGFNNKEILEVDAYRERVLADLKKAGILTTHTLKAYNTVIMNPAYVHLSKESLEEKEKLKKELAKNSIYTIGRYGDWKYCSIEDCIAQAGEIKEITL